MNKKFLAVLVAFVFLFTFLTSCAIDTDKNINSEIKTVSDIISKSSSSVSSDTGSANSDEDLSSKHLLEVNFIDVGQGDAMLIKTPDEKFILIDSGPSDAEDDLINFLKSRNVKEIEYTFFTHPHADHIGNADKIIKKYTVKNVYMPDISTTTKTYKDLLDQLGKKKDTKVIQAKAGQKITVGEVTLDILSPIKTKYDDLNEYSIVIKLTYGKKTILFMGDAHSENEKEMIDAGCDLKADILKVGHHGSDSSTSIDFLSKVSPQYAVISCGKDNSFNHPNKTTLEKLANVKAKIYRTDLDGTVTVYCSGLEFVFKTVK